MCHYISAVSVLYYAQPQARRLMIMIKREMYMKRIRPFIGTELIKVMTGILRCGKSVMLELIKEELVESDISPAQFISINFENLNYAHLQTAKALHDEITRRAADIPGKVYLFFDEIQEVKDWEKCINSLRVSLDCDIYITGSNGKLLSGELSTYPGGRYMEFIIYPFSFAEFLELYRPITPDEPIQKCFQKYLLSGGMPYLANIRYEDAPSRLYLHDLFNSVQLKDIVKRNKIRDVDLLERIIAYVIANVGTTFSATSLAKFLKNEKRTVAPKTKRLTLHATSAERSCMFRLLICWHPMRPSSVSSARMTVSAISCWQRNGINSQLF